MSRQKDHEPVVIVLAMHGSPPSDFPRGELAEFFGLHMRIELSGIPETQKSSLSERHAMLERKMACWPRTEANDPFHHASERLAAELSRLAGCDVILGFNEFCAPSMDEALDKACGQGAGKVVVVTPMMTRGGEHSERDIPHALDRARSRHPGVEFVYAWPFPPDRIASFLAEQVRTFLPGDTRRVPPGGACSDGRSG